MNLSAKTEVILRRIYRPVTPRAICTDVIMYILSFLRTHDLISSAFEMSQPVQRNQRLINEYQRILIKDYCSITCEIDDDDTVMNIIRGLGAKTELSLIDDQHIERFRVTRFNVAHASAPFPDFIRDEVSRTMSDRYMFCQNYRLTTTTCCMAHNSNAVPLALDRYHTKDRVINAISEIFARAAATLNWMSMYRQVRDICLVQMTADALSSDEYVEIHYTKRSLTVEAILIPINDENDYTEVSDDDAYVVIDHENSSIYVPSCTTAEFMRHRQIFHVDRKECYILGDMSTGFKDDTRYLQLAHERSKFTGPDMDKFVIFNARGITALRHSLMKRDYDVDDMTVIIYMSLQKVFLMGYSPDFERMIRNFGNPSMRALMELEILRSRSCAISMMARIFALSLNINAEISSDIWFPLTKLGFGCVAAPPILQKPVSTHETFRGEILSRVFAKHQRATIIGDGVLYMRPYLGMSALEMPYCTDKTKWFNDNRLITAFTEFKMDNDVINLISEVGGVLIDSECETLHYITNTTAHDGMVIKMDRVDYAFDLNMHLKRMGYPRLNGMFLVYTNDLSRSRHRAAPNAHFYKPSNIEYTYTMAHFPLSFIQTHYAESMFSTSIRSYAVLDSSLKCREFTHDALVPHVDDTALWEADDADDDADSYRYHNMDEMEFDDDADYYYDDD